MSAAIRELDEGRGVEQNKGGGGRERRSIVGRGPLGSVVEMVGRELEEQRRVVVVYEREKRESVGVWEEERGRAEGHLADVRGRTTGLLEAAVAAVDGKGRALAVIE